MSKKIAIVESIAATPHLETAGELAIRFKMQNHNVFFFWAGYDLEWNDWELGFFSKLLGGSYKKKIDRFSALLLKKDIKTETCNSVINTKKIKNWSKNFNGNLKALKNYKYDGKYLGMGVASSLISYLKITNINTKKNKKKIKSLLFSSCIVYERTKKFLEKLKPDVVYTFNNRFATCYPIICAAEKLNIKVFKHERGSDNSKFEIYKKDVHDMDDLKKKITYYWSKNKNKSRNQEAKKYFLDKLNRKKNINTNRVIFNSDQIKGNLPELPKNKRIITFFTSRDYEKASLINMEIDQLKAFRKFKKIVDEFNDIFLVIRVHPSFNKKTSDDDLEWVKFSSNNTLVIKSFENYDSYSLMFESDLVVSHSSSIIVEAAYFKKKTISLGEFWWSGQNVVEEPKTKNDLRKMLNKNYKFKKKNLLKCLQFANYFLTFGINYKFYKSLSSTKGKFLNEVLTWKPKFLIFLEKLEIFNKFKNFFFLNKKF